MTEELGVRALHRWECLTGLGRNTAGLVPLRPLCGPLSAWISVLFSEEGGQSQALGSGTARCLQLSFA